MKTKFESCSQSNLLIAIQKFFFLACTLIFASNAEAYQWMKHITQNEYLMSSAMCKRAIAIWNNNHSGALEFAPQIRKEESVLPENWESGDKEIWRAGGWHYCGGVIRIRRGEASLNANEKQDYLEHGVRDCSFTWKAMDKRTIWAAEIGTTIARGYKGLKNYEKATQYLDRVIEYHPLYEPAHLLYGLIYYDQEKYEDSKKYFAKAIDVADGKSAQGEYFLGLASVKTNDLENAKLHAEEAERLGYPLTGLRRLIAQAKNEDP